MTKTANDCKPRSTHSGAKFVRFYPSDWRSGCIGLSFAQEGFYIRVCAYIYETGRRLPADDKLAAKFVGAHTNAYVKIRNELAAIGKLTTTPEGEWTVDRAERELSAARSAHVGATRHTDGTQSEDRRTAVSVGNTLPDTLGVTPLVTPPVTPPVCSEKANEIKAPLIEPITNSQEPREEETGFSATREDKSADLAADMVASIQEWMPTIGNVRQAHTWLRSQMLTYGKRPTIEAYHKLKTDIIEGAISVNKLQTWSVIAKRLQDEAEAKKAKPKQKPEFAKMLDARARKPTVREIIEAQNAAGEVQP